MEGEKTDSSNLSEIRRKQSGFKLLSKSNKVGSSPVRSSVPESPNESEKSGFFKFFRKKKGADKATAETEIGEEAVVEESEENKSS